MYKKQLKAQKIICLVALIMCVVVFVYALGIMTDIYDSLYLSIGYDVDKNTQEYRLLWDDIPGAFDLYFGMQAFNRSFVAFSIALLVVSLLLFLSNTNTRRRYYFGNYFAVGAYSAAAVALTVYAHINIEKYKNQFLTTIKVEDIRAFSESKNNTIPVLDNTRLFDLHYFVFALLLLAVIALILNVVWKASLMKEEKVLLQNGEGAKA